MIDESGKKNPFEPLSMKLEDNVLVLYVVVKLPEAFVVYTVALPSELLDSVPIPMISEPVTESAPFAPTDGSDSRRPLLSVGSSQTGFCTWALNDSVTPLQLDELQE